jgi:hypothetical protein
MAFPGGAAVQTAMKHSKSVWIFVILVIMVIVCMFQYTGAVAFVLVETMLVIADGIWSVKTELEGTLILKSRVVLIVNRRILIE